MVRKHKPTKLTASSNPLTCFLGFPSPSHFGGVLLWDELQVSANQAAEDPSQTRLTQHPLLSRPPLFSRWRGDHPCNPCQRQRPTRITQMRSERIGNRRKLDGTPQELVFVVQDVLGDRFESIRIQDNVRG